MFDVSCICRFLLGRHRAAIDVYSEAASMKDTDWVIVAHPDVL